MNRLALVGAIAVIVIVISIIAAAIWLFIPWLLPQKDAAVNIAMSDPEIRDAMRKNAGSVTIGNDTPLDKYDESGYVNVSDTLVQVPMKMGTYYGGDRYIVYVDLDKSAVLGKEWYSYRGIPASMDVTIPPGASWYHLLSGPVLTTNGTQDFFFGVRSFGPADARIYPGIVDEANLDMLKNGSDYEPAKYIDTYTHQPATMNGTVPVYPGWRANASVQRQQVYDPRSWPAFDFSPRYYIVLRNGDMRDVNVSIGIY
jgi:hypothetical protein